MSEIGVVHLVRAANGLAPLRAFLDSYRQHEAGVAHELLLVLKGFPHRRLPDDYRTALGGLRHWQLLVPDRDFDIGSYYRAARTFGHKYFCFLNSYSVILDDGWLAKLYRHITRPGIGLVGASGSYETWHPGGDRLPLFPWRPVLGALRRLWFRTAVEQLRARQQLRYWFRHSLPFPNPHIRTNGFLIARDVLLRVKCPPLRSKLDAWRFECGKDGLTRQILGMGLEPLVVGKDGQAYEMARWFESHTFRSGGQRNLLIADNQTRRNVQVDADNRQILAESTWGEKAHDAEYLNGLVDRSDGDASAVHHCHPDL
jgi:hypothetical protein